MSTNNPELPKWEARQAELQHRLSHAPFGDSETQWILNELARQKAENPHAMTPAMQAIWDSRYERVPVPVREFLSGPDYLNLTIGETGVYPKIADALQKLFDSEYTEVVLAGSIGWGKSTFGTLAIAYDLYKVSCLRDPAITYGMKTGSNVTFVNISVDKLQAQRVFFTDLYNLIAGSYYFNRVFPYDRSLKTELRFPNNVHCYPVAASEQAALGVGVFSAFIDEVNFMDVVERSKRSAPGMANVYDQAEMVYNKLAERMLSRFNKFGKLPGHLYASSSARYPDDFTERLAKRAREEAEKGQRHIMYLDYAVWDTKPEGTISKETFQVEVGDLTRASRILTGAETDVVEANVINVPVDYRLPFERDPERAVQNLAGKSVLSIRPFISQRERINRMFELGEQAGLKHPFTKLTVTLQDSDPALERLLPENLHWIEVPKLGPTGAPLFDAEKKPIMQRVLFPALYHAHFDLAKTGDAAGLVIAHNIGARKVPRFDLKTLHDVDELKPVIRVDLALQIVKPPRGEIDIPRIRAICYQLQRSYGMTFGKITYDTFGSQESVKTMKDEGFDADILSVDKDTTPYDMLRTAIYDERVLCYKFPILQRELTQLERGRDKIDHPAPASASKDIADCLAACVYHCEESWRCGEMNKGLFQVGLVERAGELSPEMVTSLEQINAKVADGQQLTDSDENTLLFGDLDKL